MTNDFNQIMTILAPQINIDPECGLGGDVFDSEILLGLARRGHNIIILLPEECKQPEGKNIEVIPVKKKWYHIFLLKNKDNWIFIPEILKVLKRTHVDYIRIHSPYNTGIGIALLKLFYRRTPLLWISYLHLEDRPLWILIDKILPRFMDVITVISEDTREDIIERCPLVKSKALAVTPCGVDTDYFTPVRGSEQKRHELGFNMDDTVLLFVGQLIQRKGLDILLNVWEKVKDTGKMRLVIVGDDHRPSGPGEYAKEIIKKAEEDERVTHFFLLKKDDLRELYSVADILAFPSRHEGFGFVVAEAMSCELPVVASACKGVRGIVVDGETGYLTPVNDVNAMAEKILVLAGSTEKRKVMGAKGRKHISENFTWNASLNKTERILRENL